MRRSLAVDRFSNRVVLFRTSASTVPRRDHCDCVAMITSAIYPAEIRLGLCGSSLRGAQHHTSASCSMCMIRGGRLMRGRWPSRP